MSEIRLNFLNWRPDMEPSGHDGLTEADNVLHDTEGYKQLRVATSGAAATAAASANTLGSVQVRQLGSKQDTSEDNKMACYLVVANPSGVGVRIQVGSSTFNSESTLTASAGTAHPVATGGAITAFEVCELNDYVFITAQGEGEAAGGTALSGNVTAYMEINV